MQQDYANAAGRQKTSPVSQETKEIARQGTEQAKQIGQTAKDRALYEVNNQRERIADEMEKLAGTIEGQGGGTPILNLAASAARSFSSTLKDRSAEELFAGVTRNPVTVLAGSFALGFLAVRLFKA
jgi:hypothetical protein